MNGPNPAFLRLAAEARKRIHEITVPQLTQALRTDPRPLLIDVRETEEFAAGHVPGARHLSRGIIEQRIAEVAPGLDTTILCYCAGGNRSALAADSLRQMGYSKVSSLAEGYRGWTAAGQPVAR